MFQVMTCMEEIVQKKKKRQTNPDAIKSALIFTPLSFLANNHSNEITNKDPKTAEPDVTLNPMSWHFFHLEAAKHFCNI